ncbi:unnamed protein product [Closterium sp. Yama58-4]|nr:unnamed protein product [Closterium sp. Yama58-4]
MPAMALNLFKRGQSVLLMLPDGGMRIYADAVRVARVMKDYPGFMVGSHNSARLHLPPEKLLRPGNSYFLHAPSQTDPDTAVPSPHLDTTGGLAEYTRDYGEYNVDEKSPDQRSHASGASWTANESRRASMSLHPSTAARPSLPSRANSAPRYSLDVRNVGRGGIRRSFSAKDLQNVPIPPPPAAPAPAPFAPAPKRPPASRLGMRRSASAQNLADPVTSVEAAVARYSYLEPPAEHPNELESPSQPHHRRGFHARHGSMDWQLESQSVSQSRSPVHSQWSSRSQSRVQSQFQSQSLSQSQFQSQSLSQSQFQSQSLSQSFETQWDGSSRFAADATPRQHWQRANLSDAAPIRASSSGYLPRTFPAVDSNQSASPSGPLTAGQLTRRASLAIDMSSLAVSPSSLTPPQTFRRLPPNFQAQDVGPTPAVPPRLLSAGDVRVALGATMGKSMSCPDFAGLESGDVALRAQPGWRMSRVDSGGGSGDWGSGGDSPGAIMEGDEEEGGAERSFCGARLGRRRSGIPSRYAVPDPQQQALQSQQQQVQQQRAWMAGQQYDQPTPLTVCAPLPHISTHALNVSPSSPCQHSPSVFSPLARSAHHHSHFRHVQLQL